MSLEVNSLLDTLGKSSDFVVWLVPVLVFFWPTAAVQLEEISYRRVRKRMSNYSSSTNRHLEE